jgi:hypothetical protein
LLTIAGAVTAIVLAPFAHAVMLHPNHANWIRDLTARMFSSEMMKVTSGPLWALLIASGLLCLIAAMVRRDPRARPYLLALAGLASGVIGLALMSILVRPMFIDRYLIGCIPLAVIAAVGGWSALRKQVWSVVAVVVLAVSSLNLGFRWEATRPVSENYRAATSEYLASVLPDDALVAIGGFPIFGLLRYLPAGAATATIVGDGSNPGSFVILDQRAAELEPSRIWILHRDIATSPELQAWIEQRFPKVISDRDFGSIRLELRGTPNGI